jgi:hypothetical protein
MRVTPYPAVWQVPTRLAEHAGDAQGEHSGCRDVQRDEGRQRECLNCRPMGPLIIVVLRNDFCEGGAPMVPEGAVAASGLRVRT